MPWLAAHAVWVAGTGHKGPVVFRVARLHVDQVPPGERTMRALYAAWVKLSRTLTPDEAERIIFEEALKG